MGGVIDVEKVCLGWWLGWGYGCGAKGGDGFEFVGGFGWEIQGGIIVFLF